MSWSHWFFFLRKSSLTVSVYQKPLCPCVHSLSPEMSLRKSRCFWWGKKSRSGRRGSFGRVKDAGLQCGAHLWHTKLTNRADSVPCLLSFLHVVASFWPLVAPPPSAAFHHQRWGWRSFLVFRLSLAWLLPPTPCLHPPWLNLTTPHLSPQTDSDSENVLSGQSQVHGDPSHPSFAENILPVFNELTNLSLSFSKSQARSLIFLDATWKCHPLYLFFCQM